LVSYVKVQEVRPKIVTAFSPLPFEARTSAIYQAYEWGKELHAGQMRLSGEPYFDTHCVWVAAFIDRLTGNEAWTISALLHDSVEDRGGSLDMIREKFPGLLGEQVAFIVDGMTKLSVPGGWTREIETLRKIAMFRDPGVFLVKLADKTHNIMTLEHMPPEKKIKKATEAIRAYGKLAGILNCYEWRRYLEDLAFPYMDPETYTYVKNIIDADQRLNPEFINPMQDELAQIMAKQGMEGVIQITVNGYWQSWQKLRRMARERKASMNDFRSVNDIISFRLVVTSNNERDCYSLLPAVNRYLGPYIDQNRFDDYIAFPQNGYQALQLTAWLPDFGAIEVAIMTEQMEGENSWGIVYALQNNLDTSHYQPVEILTPSGGVRFVQDGSTVLDAIASIQQEFWLDKIGRVEVNGKLSRLSEKVKPGDVIEIIPSTLRQQPTEEWLSFCNTNTARLLRMVLATEALKKAAEKGRETASSVIEACGLLDLDDIAVLEPNRLHNLLGILGSSSLEDLYAAIGSGAIRLVDFSKAMMEAGIRKDTLGWTSINIIGSKESNVPGVLAQLALIISSVGANILRSVNTTAPDGCFYLRLVVQNIDADKQHHLDELLRTCTIPLDLIELV